MRKLEYELKQKSCSELAEKIKCARNRISYANTKTFAWQTSPEKPSKMSVIGQKSNSPEKFLIGGHLSSKRFGMEISHLSKLLKNYDFLKLLLFLA